MEYAHIMPEDIFKNPEVKVYVEAGNSCLGALGFTEHGRPHAKRCSNYARNILEALDYDTRTCELAAIAGYLHDIGNTVNRVDHAHSGAIMAFTLLTRHEHAARKKSLSSARLSVTTMRKPLSR